ncbi:MAG: acyloxyacyl hydrolase, partial [Candidatus Sulfotelmatobacter sp.]
MFAPPMSKCCFAGIVRFRCFSLLALLCLLAPQLAYSQETETAGETNPPSATATEIASDTPVKQSVQSEISVMGMFPDGDYRLFSATTRCYAWTVRVEYDRNSWGRFLGSQFDYVAEVLPVLILSQPAVSDFWGNAKSPNQVLVPGLSISPFGLRMMWRSNTAIKPYIVGKLGAIAFTRKAFSQSASYANFNVQAAFGVQLRLTKRFDLRVEPFEFFHVSNGYLAASNPG